MPASHPPRAFAIVPAAGESRRMGTPKLLLPVQAKPLIAHTIAAWLAAGLKPYVVVRKGDQSLANVCQECGATVIQPTIDPPEMKDSVQIALEYIKSTKRPQSYDAWLLAPADMPRLSPAIIGKLLAAHQDQLRLAEPPAILIPLLAGRRGHPVLFPWPLAAQVSQLTANEGINALRSRNPVREIACDALRASEAFMDVDTPADYDRLR
jgi:molybdenum cofactor cytidylyltransferase